MNPAVLVALNLINQIFVANGNQEITGTNSNPVLQAILNSLYGITGDPEYLTTFDKTNLVSAINEVNDLVGQINTIKLFSGDANPNVVPPNGGDYGVRDFYMQTDNVGTIALWIYSGVMGVEWLNLTANLTSLLYTPQTLTLAQKKQALKNLGWIEIGGNLFEYKRNPNNNTVGFIAGDIAVNGWIAPNNFGKLLVYVSGTPTEIASWNIIDNLEF